MIKDLYYDANIGLERLSPTTNNDNKLEKILKLLEWRNNNNVKKFMTNTSDISEEEHLNWFNSIQEDNYIFLITTDNSYSKHVGMISAKHIGNKEYEFGLYIGVDNYRGRGLGVYAEKLLIKIMFSDTDCECIVCNTKYDNTSVIKIHNSLGFIKIAVMDGYVQQKLYKDGI